MEKYTAGWPEWLILAVTILSIIVIFLWIFLPFAIVSIQRKTIQIYEVNKKILAELKKQNKESGGLRLNKSANKVNEKTEPKI